MDLYKRLGITKHTTTSYHPQSDGVVERLNATLINSLSHLVSHTQEDWDRHLSFALLAHRTGRHSALQECPAYILYGRDLCLPVDLLLQTNFRTYDDTNNYSKDLTLRLQKTFQLVNKHLTEAAERQETFRERSSQDKGIQVGDVVYLYTPVVKPGMARKLSKLNQGPFRVVEQVTKVNYKIASITNPDQVQTVHVDRLTKVPERINFPTLQNCDLRSAEQPENDTHNYPYHLRPRDIHGFVVK
ncbi:Retrovirus-related Pol polyprotein from transposon 412, partial [Stegodyphus mimosarum]